MEEKGQCTGTGRCVLGTSPRGLGAGAGGAGALTPRSPGLCVVQDNGSAHFEAQGAGRPSPGDTAPRHREALTADQAALLLTGGARTRASERTGCGLVPGGSPRLRSPLLGGPGQGRAIHSWGCGAGPRQVSAVSGGRLDAPLHTQNLGGGRAGERGGRRVPAGGL